MNRSPQVFYQFDSFRVDPVQKLVWKDGVELKVTPRVICLLLVFVKRPRHILTNEELLAEVWPDSIVEENNLTVQINSLRRVIGSQYIENVPRRGYRFNAEVKSLTGKLPRSSSNTPGGAIAVSSKLYISRLVDEEFFSALNRQDSIVLLKGARQTGKTSLLARGLNRMRDAGAKVVVSDFGQLQDKAFNSSEGFLLTLAESIADELELDRLPHENWRSHLTAASNFGNYLRRVVMASVSEPLVWAMDEVDRLFEFSYASEIFGLFRSWHNQRALDPLGPWQRLTLAMSYSTEASLFITDFNQSPFNVGTRLVLEDFDLNQIAEFSQRYGGLFRSDDEIKSFFDLLSGHPYLVHCGFHEMAERRLSLADLEAQADKENGPFAHHLHRLIDSLERDSILCKSLCDWLQGKSRLTQKDFYRLLSAGVVIGDTPDQARIRCELYARYLKKRLLMF